MIFFHTIVAYPKLPDTVPLHLDWQGSIDNSGPRWMIFLLPVLSVVVSGMMAFAGYAIATHAPGTHGTLLGFAIVAVCVMALLWRAQALLISVAKSGGNRVSMRGFWMFFAVWMLIVLIDAFAIG